ncbi:hypothetical protein [Roseiconus lacunae]|uniref:Tyr recombinase domain-containing protein n=1 Tax=Roseiconus lacunae TaxID=2605694 RepID=A0ABT7PHN1_9BACT|nr:hypothetical protein [Roseiconus lacunae]MDM4015993.1 hypothetical protein [Roseiconus lacunae]
MALRIYGTPADGADDPKRQTLRAAYARHLAPSQVDRRANKTTQGYRTALGHWEAFVASQSGESTGQTDARGSITNTPAPESVPFCRPVDQIGAITDDMLNAWGVWLMASDGAQLSLGTAAKQWRHIRAILRRVGPRESGNPRGAGILDAVPAMDPLAELAVIDELGVLTDGAEDITDDQIDAIYDACDVATWPAGSPALQWKTYLVILSVMGPRVNDAATLTAANFSFDPTSPIRRSVRTYPHGWLIYLPTKTKSKKPARLIVPLPPCVAAHVSALESRRRGELFGWNDARGHAFARQWQRIVATAGLPHVERRHFRSTANIRWDRAGGDRQLGRWVLGHASRDVNDQHYMRAEPDLIEAAPLVEVPSRFNGGNPGDAPSQLFLFS